MTRYVKIAISLPAELLETVDRRREAAGATRSQYFREAVEAQLAGSVRSDIDQYIEGYRLQPESDEEVEAAMGTAAAVLAAEPWT